MLSLCDARAPVRQLRAGLSSKETGTGSKHVSIK